MDDKKSDPNDCHCHNHETFTHTVNIWGTLISGEATKLPNSSIGFIGVKGDTGKTCSKEDTKKILHNKK